jgi:predicted ribosome-associated RNA-binding protein Tma20
LTTNVKANLALKQTLVPLVALKLNTEMAGATVVVDIGAAEDVVAGVVVVVSLLSLQKIDDDDKHIIQTMKLTKFVLFMITDFLKIELRQHCLNDCV